MVLWSKCSKSNLFFLQGVAVTLKGLLLKNLLMHHRVFLTL